MRSLVQFCVLGAVLVTARATASDPFLDFDSEKYGVSVTRERSVMDYAGVNALKDADPSRIRVLVTTESLTPDAETYAVAEALFDGLKQTYAGADFKVWGRVDNKEVASDVRANYDYVFMVGTNNLSREYERDETIYGSRTSAVRCSSSELSNSVDCRETGSQSVPIGTRKAQATIFTDIFFASYGTARQISASWRAESFTPELAISSPIAHVAVIMRYGQSDASWCENKVGAQTTLARMAGASILFSRPDKVSFNAAPDDIGCGD